MIENETTGSETESMENFVITDEELLKYNGNEENIIVPTSVKKINSGAFSNCSSVKSIEIPEGVVFIGYRAFSDCTNLEKITIPGSVKEICPNIFDNCSKLKDVCFHGKVDEWENLTSYYYSEELCEDERGNQYWDEVRFDWRAGICLASTVHCIDGEGNLPKKIRSGKGLDSRFDCVSYPYNDVDYTGYKPK